MLYDFDICQKNRQLLIYGLSGEGIQVPKHIIDLYKKETKPENLATTKEIQEIHLYYFQ